jgi:hypothetical protein
MMRIGHVIYLSSAGCALWTWRGWRFEESAVRTAVGADPRPLVEELARLDPEPVAVLVDMIDEEHVRDVVARLGRRDQQALLARKLARTFPRTAWRSAQLQGRNAANPDEDHALLSALTRPEPLRSLMQRLAAARLPVAGVFSPALLAERLLDAEARAASAVMLVLRRSNGRLQHSFFREGRLAGSRRLRASASVAQEDPALMLRQLEESLRYFDPTFAAGADNPLQVMLMPADLELLQVASGRSEDWQLRPLDPVELGRRLRVRAVVNAGETERLFIELLRRPGGSAGFAPPAEQRYFRFFRIRRLARAACLAVAGGALAWTLYNVLVIAETNQRMASSVATARSLETVLPGHVDPDLTTVDPLEMQQAVLAYEALLAHQTDAGAILAAVSAAVSRQPRIQVDAIRWAADAGTPADAVGASDAAELGMDDVAAVDDGITVTISGHIGPFDGDYPLAFDEVAAFMDSLRRIPAVERVTATAQPLDIGPSSTLSGELTRRGAAPEAPFSVELQMRRSDETV